MAQNKNSKSTEKVGKKLYNAVFVSPFRSKTRRISHQTHQPHDSNSAADVPKPAIPIESEPPVAYFPVPEIEKKVWKQDELIHERRDEGEAMFSDYISKVRQQMSRTESNVGGGGGGVRITTRRDSFNDKVTSYIKRAKMMIRTTTNVGIEDFE